tara:strand:+ start:1990 stop:2592 length:603 start_codon:yes stop_codon:yes gene_type:complete
MKYGYARVSTKDQNLDLQIDALKKSGCQKIFKETASGAKTSRPKLDELLSIIQKDDVVVIWKLDRMGRSLQHLIKIVNELNEKGIGITSLQDPIDTTTAQGRLMFNMFASLAEFEKDIIYERTMAGLSSARARGRMGGRPKGLSKSAQEKACVAEALYKQGELSTEQIAKQLGVSRTTMYKYLKSRNVKIGSVSIESKIK